MKTNLAAWVLAAAASAGCKSKVTPSECDQLVDRYATLVVQERMADASVEAVRVAQERERAEAKGDDDFKNCTTEVQRDEYACAMKATAPKTLLKCLE